MRLYRLGVGVVKTPRMPSLVPVEVKKIKTAAVHTKEWVDDFRWASKQGKGFKSYYKQGLANVGDEIMPTFPSKDFVRLVTEQETSISKIFSTDYATAGLVPANQLKMYPITPLPYAKTLYTYWYTAWLEGEKKWGKGAFPQATKALIEASKAYSGGKASRTVNGYRILDPKDNVTFWRAIEKVALQLGSKDFAVTQEEKWRAFAQGANEGLQSLAEGLGNVTEGAAGILGKTLLSFFKGLGPIVTIIAVGGGGYLGYKLILKR